MQNKPTTPDFGGIAGMFTMKIEDGARGPPS